MKRFPSLYLEGAAACGKTTAVKMLLSRHLEVTPEVLWMDQEVLSPEHFLEQLQRIKTRMEQQSFVWLILENMPEELPRQMAEEIGELIKDIPESCRVIMLGREQLDEFFLALLWERKLELLPQKVLLFTKEEIEQFAKRMGCFHMAEEVYQLTGGWAGCVDLYLRFLAKDTSENDRKIEKLRRSYEIDEYIKNTYGQSWHLFLNGVKKGII